MDSYVIMKIEKNTNYSTQMVGISRSLKFIFIGLLQRCSMFRPSTEAGYLSLLSYPSKTEEKKKNKVPGYS